MYDSKSTIKMEEKQYTSLTVPTDYLQQWYQSTQQHPQAQHVMQYHNTGHVGQYMDGSREDRVMTELSVHQELPVHQEFSIHQEFLGHQDLDFHHDFTGHQEPIVQHHHQPADPSQAPTPGKRKRGRPPKQKLEEGKQQEEYDQNEAIKKAKRALNRFNGMSVAEVMAKTLPDIIAHNLDILIIGINPGLLSAFKGRHYPNPGNHFWKCLFLSGLTEEQLNHMHDQSLPDKYGIGFTNMVERTTPGSKDLSSKEFREGGRQLVEKLKKYKPLIAAFNGKCIYEIFCKEIFGVKAKNLVFGLQPYKIPETETVCYLMPSSSPRCAQFPRAQDKVHFYVKLKELRDKIKGGSPTHREVQETDYSFDLQLAKDDAKRLAIKEENVDPEYENCGGAHEDAKQSTSYCNIPHTKDTEMARKDHAPATGDLPYDQWMTQSFADQIPDISCNSSNVPQPQMGAETF
ncbi:G/T mismatch-specific thymine DNA glycosylase isoform X1 [Osmerus eperlanus]|uniref:G/T mismatch-specific thymine DNA glycosylase isoform X1 n=2 Tax=Osmerus eperlanus TaxID=29151 RepID=UPI002E13FE60